MNQLLGESSRTKVMSAAIGFADIGIYTCMYIHIVFIYIISFIVYQHVYII